MNIKELKRKQSKIIGIIVTIMLLAMSVPINKSVAVDTGNTASTANTASVAELETTASADGTIEVTKIWDDEENTANRPQSVTYKLYKKSDRTNPVKTLTLNSTTNKIDDYTWQGTFTDIPQKENDEDITYIVTEENIANYISIADKTALQSNSTQSDLSAGIKFKFDPNTKFADGNPSLYDTSKALKLFAYDIKNNQWYGLVEEHYNTNPIENYIFYSGKISNPETEYVITIENDMTECDPPTNRNKYVDTSFANELLGLCFPESKHPLRYGDDTVWTYMASPKSNIKWFFDLDMESWGGYWGMKIDDIKTMGRSNYFVSTYNRQDIQFQKVFDDEGFEDLREDSEFYLYDNNEKIATVTLNTATNKGVDEWNGSFKNVPIYDSNWKEIEYRIEEKKNDNYTIYYDIPEDYNGLEIKFSEDTNLSRDAEFKIGYPTENGWIQAKHRSSGSWNGNYGCAITNGTIFIPAKEFYISIENLSETQKEVVKIESIKPVANVDRENDIRNDSIFRNIFTHTGKDYLNFDSSKTSEYYLDSNYTSKIGWRYKYSDTQSFGTNKIINKINKAEVKKVWDDNGSKSTRPQSIKIDISNVDNPDTIVKTVELTAEDEDEQDGNVWKKVITGLPEYDENGYKINYIYKEQEQDNYKTTYESSKKLTGYEITMENGTNMYDFFSDVYLKSYQLTVPPVAGDQAGNQFYYSISYNKIPGGNPDGLTYKFIIPIKDDNPYYDKNGPKIAFYVNQSALNKSFKIKSIRPVYEDEYVVNAEGNNPFSGSEQVTKSTLEVAQKFSQTADIVLDTERIQYFHSR